MARKLSVHTSPCLSSYAVSSVRWVTHQRQLFVSSPLLTAVCCFSCMVYFSVHITTAVLKGIIPYFRALLETLLEIKSIGITLFFRFRWFPVEFVISSTVLFYSKIGTVKTLKLYKHPFYMY